MAYFDTASDICQALMHGIFVCSGFGAAVLFGLPAASLLGFGGIGGLTFGLAAKDLISNFIGGSMLAVMRPFSPVGPTTTRSLVSCSVWCLGSSNFISGFILAIMRPFSQAPVILSHKVRRKRSSCDNECAQLKLNWSSEA